ncbi:MAG TPA: hypothetical protein VLS48_06275, partial [Anaerolineales bacterium]|nr:hypothetical protein [Anaerolineales bacterium]
MTREYTQLERNRLEKMEELRAEGIEPYPHRVVRTHTTRQAVAAFEAWEQEEEAGAPPRISVAGRLRSMRAMGKITFAHIEDGDGRLQLFLQVNEIGPERL